MAREEIGGVQPVRAEEIRPRRSRRQKPIFPTSDINFSSGEYRSKSKNVAAQPTMFDKPNPYARNLPYNVRQALTTGIQVGTPRSQAPQLQTEYGAQKPTTGFTVSGGYGQPVQPTYDPNEAANYTISPPGTVARPVGEDQNNPNQQVSSAARLLMQALSGNPFITPEGIQRMQRGYAPLENEINPAFYRYTSPVIQQALSGLRQSVGFRPEEQQFTAAAFRPRSLY